MKSDYQQSRVYKWENSSVWSEKGTKTLEIYELKYLNKRLNKLFGLKTQLQDKYANGSCHYNTYEDAIYLAGYGFNWSVYLHEYAHALTTQYKPSHGKEFVSAFCALLHFVHPDKPSMSDLAKSANNYDLDFVSLKENIWYKKLSRSRIDITLAKKPVEKIIEPKKPLNQVYKNYNKLKSRKDNLLKKQKQYESNLKRVANSLKKVERSIAQYEKKYDEERLTSKFSEPVERKVGKHPKQKLAELCEQHEWLGAERDEGWEHELRIDVWDNRVDNWFEGEMYEDMRDASGSWKGAYEFALSLVEEDKET